MIVQSVSSLHPAFVLRGNAQSAVQLIADLARVARVAATDGGWQSRDDLVICLPQRYGPEVVDRAEAYLNWWRVTRTPVAIDVETTGRDRDTAIDPKRCGLKTIGVAGKGGDVGVSFPMVGEHLDLHQRGRLTAALRALCRDPDVPKIFFNFSFDTAVLARFGFPVIGEIIDELIKHHAIEPDSKHGLGTVAHTYLDTEPWKDIQEELGPRATIHDLCVYNAKDALRTAQLDDPLNRDVQARGLGRVVYEQTRWSKVAARMEAVGLPIHRPTLLEYDERLRVREDATLEECRRACGYADLNLHREVEARWFLYDVLRLPVRKWTKKKNLPATSGKAVVEHIIDPTVGGAVRAYIKWLETAQTRATFIQGVDERILPATGRLHPRWNTTGQKGSRWSSSNPNLQNWPAYLRSMVRAPFGRKFVQGDQAQLEYRIIAALAGARRLLEIFADPSRDAHTEMASFVFKAEFDTLPAKSKLRSVLRTLVKRVVYALQYGAGVEKIQQSLFEDRKLPVEVRAFLTLTRVQAIYDGFFEANPEIRTWREGLLRQVESIGYIEIPPLGRRRYFVVPDRNKVFNWPIQTLGSDIVNLALVNIHEKLPLGAETLVHGHDAGLWECSEKDAPFVKELVEREMHFTLNGPAGPVDLTLEAEIVDAWYEGSAADWPN